MKSLAKSLHAMGWSGAEVIFAWEKLSVQGHSKGRGKACGTCICPKLRCQ